MKICHARNQQLYRFYPSVTDELEAIVEKNMVDSGHIAINRNSRKKGLIMFVRVSIKRFAGVFGVFRIQKTI